MTESALPKVASKAHCTLGESPLWHPAEAALYWIDIPGRRLWRLAPALGLEQSWSLPEEPGCIGLVGTAEALPGQLVITLRSGFHRLRIVGETLDLTLLAASTFDRAEQRFNDGKVDTIGRFWAGSIYEPRGQAKAGLYCLSQGVARAVTGPQAHGAPHDHWGVTTSNGLAFSSDGRLMYQSDTPAHVIYRYDLAPSDGLPRQRDVWWRTADDRNSPDYGGRPDGGALDEAGCYWSAQYEGGRIVQLSPAGELLQSIAVPARCPTMVAFGGSDRRTLYVTTARAGRADAELERYPDSGRVFSLRVPMAGQPSGVYRDPAG